MSEEKQAKKTAIEEKKINSPGRSFAIFGILVLLVILAGYFIYSQKKTMIAQANSNAQIENLTKEINFLTKQHAKTEHQLMQNAQNIAHLNKKTGTKDERWILEEANYLIRLANFNLQFSHNVSEAKLLLKTANNRVATLKDPRLLPLRQSIANDMSKLAAVPSVDTAGILVQLNAISANVNKLPIIATPEDVQVSKKIKKQAHKKPNWKYNLEKSWQEIRRLVVVQYHESPVSKLITPANRGYLDMHLQLLLSQASWALMHNDAKLYRQSLQQAQIWIRNYYVGNSSKTQAMLSDLKSLKVKNITPDYPDISGTLSLINQHLKE